MFSKLKHWIVLVGCILGLPYLQLQLQDEITDLENYFPREMMGIFIGDSKIIVGNVLMEACILTIRRPEKKFALFYVPGPCAINRNLSARDFFGNALLQFSQTGETFKVQCRGKGWGYHWVNFGGSPDSGLPYLHSCGVFERDGDSYYWTIGFQAGSPLEARCPPSARSEPLVDPLTMSQAKLKAVGDKTRQLTEDMYTCQ